MKKSLLIGLVVSLIAVPTLSMAGESAGQYILLASNRLSDQELSVTSGQGLAPQQLVQNQKPQGRIVIWDDWAHSAAGGKGANAASPGQVSINYATRQATVTAGR
jgi:hypothetical protein